MAASLHPTATGAFCMLTILNYEVAYSISYWLAHAQEALRFLQWFQAPNPVPLLKQAAPSLCTVPASSKPSERGTGSGTAAPAPTQDFLLTERAWGQKEGSWRRQHRSPGLLPTCSQKDAGRAQYPCCQCLPGSCGMDQRCHRHSILTTPPFFSP